MNEWPVFLCYRQTDGTKTAQWLHGILRSQTLGGSSEIFEEPPTLVVYFDVAAPAVSDWKHLHGRELGRCRAFLVICTPGACVIDGAEDWVHKEINWWLHNRRTAPILIDATGEGQRWVPQKIRERWPNAQLVKVDVHAWAGLSEPERESKAKITLDRILAGITESERNVRLEDLTKHMARAERATADGEELTAEILLVHAFELDKSDDIRDHFLAHMYLKTGDAVRAKPHLKKLMIVQQEQARKYLTRPALVDRLVLTSTTRAALDSWLLLTARSGEHAYETVLSSKGLVGRASLVERRIWRQVGRREPQVLEEYQHAHRQLSALYTEPTLSNWRARYDAAIGDLLRARAALSAHAKDHEVPYAAWLSATLADIQGQLEGSEVILDFLRYANRYSVWIVMMQGNPTRIELGSAEQIDSLVRECRSRLEKRDDRYLVASARLFDLIWSPIESQIREAETIYVVPDGDLVDFPFSALWNAHDSAFVIDRWNVGYLLSAHQILPWPDPVDLGEGALVVGVSEHAPNLHALVWGLPFAKLEAEAVGAMYPNASLLLGESATEHAFRNAAVGARILHMATHGLSLPAVDLPRILFGEDRDPTGQIQKLVEGSDPFLRSGLALYDRIATALDLSNLDLDGVDLAILSTEPVGATPWCGEGTFDLARALVEAGARTVVSASWAADDQLILELMRAFHGRLLDGYSLLDALRQAALTVRSAYPHPYYWAHLSVHGRASTKAPGA